MREAIVIIMDLAFTAFAVYGVVVLWRWHKVAKKTDAVLDEARELFREMEGENE